jgi:hypothetical protein
MVRCGQNISVSGWGPVTGWCEHGDKPSGSRESGTFLDYLIEGQLLKDSATRC